jgi:hypothetical protein
MFFGNAGRPTLLLRSEEEEEERGDGSFELSP